ncbi:type I glyceraldehyde-3-phosphate dehydrogenase [Alkaliphilus oremlandii]|uniref:Glyceraldehyde-3-phosphate dehydrogenase, type I n=1 Tax=Alkaliphilus oremlandii (strain OhILAs) TaxID=350688 RepID=A8MLZ7_ALKOO|nr:type I glyceraldehyde-3-phosphate dehydrogenase [Alkaliphilus oremlandii]ABW18164.1 glyceraldehyde-3-phosphate dehydrogenase, type I [Alkaliphilus oremlandii OhILAs]
MSIRVAINGLGRIGRLALRQLFDMDDFKIVAINDLATPEMLAYLLKYDSTQGTYKYADTVQYGENYIVVDGVKISLYKESDASKLPWEELSIDIVLECSGAYLSREKSQAHIEAGAKNVVISAPAGADIPTIVYGVNEDILKPEDHIVSAASCSTNALAPMVKALNDYTSILSGIMTVIHGYTATQMLQDGPQRKGNLRRSRAAAINIIPTTAEAAAAVGRVIPSLNGKLSGSAVRVPVPTGCLITLAAVVSGKELTVEKINMAMKAAASDTFGYTEEEYVSSDIIGITYAALFDASQTLVNKVNESEFEVRVGAWFDNENSFVSQMIRTTKYLSHI